jgi:Tfp pilus assembly PilM family ATPase
MLSFLTEPKFPKAAIGIERDAITAVSLQRSGGSFGVKRAATVEVPRNLLNPNFLERNITDPSQFRYLLEDATTSAGMQNRNRWSVSLPSSTARSAIITLDTGAAKGESEEIFEWKAEQSFGAPAAELRITREKVSADTDGRPRYFATAVKLSVLDEYETVFESLGWKCGLIVPRALSEARWLINGGERDSLLISSQWDGFTAMLINGSQPFVVRTVSCSESEREDEIYRLLMFYNDRFAGPDSGRGLDRLLLVGRGLVPATIRTIADEALGEALRIVNADEVGLNVPVGSLAFDDLAAPAGLAALGWR